jgi:hypothetical protein
MPFLKNSTTTETLPKNKLESKYQCNLTFSLETKLYSETHTKNLLIEEKKKLNAVLNQIR